MKILVTGGTGFIGSHTVVELLEKNYEVIIIDNLCNSKKEVLVSINEITGKEPVFYQGDIRDKKILVDIFQTHNIDSVIHFAGLKAVGESVEKPLEYYHNNVYGSMVLFEVMKQFGVNKIVFSSSATVYGLENESPLTEDMPTNPINPYGRTKLQIEQILNDIYLSDERWRTVILRYFNPIGAHPSGLIGEDPKDTPNNLMPYILKVANKELPKLQIFGNDYDTKDGTGVRDYIHVVDLAQAHLKALEYINESNDTATFNIGTGKGYSVLEVIKTFEAVNDVEIPYVFTDRRPGDVAECYSNPTKAFQAMGWKATKNLSQMCKSALLFIKMTH